MKKAVRAADRYKLDMERRRSEIGGKIKVLTDDIKQQIIDGIRKNIENKSLVRQILKDKKKIFDVDLSNATEKEVRDQIRQNIKDLYKGQKYKIERAVRTESINTAARAQLLKFQEAGMEEVSLETSHDPRVCPKCRNLERSRKTWDIDKLLLLGSYPLTTLTHPQCRCVFHPIIPEITLGNDVGRIKNIPKNETDSVKRLSKEIEFVSPIKFVDDITQHPRFMEYRILYYERKGYPTGKAKLMAELDKNKLQGKVTNLTVGTGKKTEVLLDVKADRNERFVYLISRIQAKRIWERKISGKKIRDDMREFFKARKFDRMNLSGAKKLLFNREARNTPKSYFIEGYANYLIHPEVLKEIDSELFEYLKTNLFKGKEYTNYAL